MAVEQGELVALAESIAEVLAAECDSRKLHDFVDAKNDLESRLWKQAAELGWLGVAIAEEHGGLGLGIEGLGVLHRELGRRLAPGPFIATLAAAHWLARFGDAAARERTLAPVAAGELQIAVPAAVAADRAAPAPAPASLHFARNVIRGSGLVMLGSPQSRFALVPLSGPKRSTSWALVAIDGKRATLTARRAWDPTRALCDLACDGAKPLFAVDDAGAGDHLARSMSVAITCDSVGAADTIFHQTIDYQKTRVQFDRPLASFQALKHRAANLKIAHDNARHLAAQAVASAEGEHAAVWPALCKAAVTDAFAYIAADCLQLHGGVGFTWEFDCHLFLKRAKLNQALVGSNETQTDRAFDAIVAAMKEGRSTLEIPL